MNMMFAYPDMVNGMTKHSLMYTGSMRNKYNIRSFILTLIVALGYSTYVSADDDYIEARQLHDAGKILPLESILERLRKNNPGKILEIELEKENGKIVYEIEILDKNGFVKEIYINAETGDILKIKEDD